MDKTIPMGAATSVYALLSPDINTSKSGAYLSDCSVEIPSKAGQDVGGKIRMSLWKASEKSIKAALAGEEVE